jgi:streptogramin lyase
VGASGEQQRTWTGIGSRWRRRRAHPATGTPRRERRGGAVLLVGALLAAVVSVATAAAGEALPAPPVVTVENHGLSLDDPTDLVAGPDGNVWFTNGGSVGRITPAGTISVFAGIRVSSSTGITLGPDGNLWFANTGSDSIGRITPSGVISTFTGGSSIRRPVSVAAGSDGRIYFLNEDTSSGSMDVNGQNLAVRGPFLGIPVTTMVADASGTLWLAGENTSLVRMPAGGAITILPGTGTNVVEDMAPGPDGNLWFVSSAPATIGKITPAGVVTAYHPAELADPVGIAAGPDGNLWFTNRAGPAPHIGSIGRFTPAGAALPLFTAAEIGAAQAIAKGPDGNLWFTAEAGRFIGRITVTGTASHFADVRHVAEPIDIATGPGDELWFTNRADGAPAAGRITTGGTTTPLGAAVTTGAVNGVTEGPDGNLWFTSSAEGAIKRVTPAGTTTTFSGSGIDAPSHITVGADGNLWFANGPGEVGRITTTGTITVFTSASIDTPMGLSAGPDDNVWFADAGADAIGRITPAGTVTTYTAPGVDAPRDIAAGADGNLWFTSNGNDQIGRITPAGTITMFTSAQVSGPTGITRGPDWNMWFTNQDGDSIGRIRPDGAIEIFTGRGIAGPSGIVAGPDRKLWFANTANSSIGSLAVLEGPGAPTAVTAVAGQRSATVSWTAPAWDGDSPIQGYNVYGGGSHCGTTGALTCTVPNLDPFVPHTFTVEAYNAQGAGQLSQVSNEVVPWDGSGYHPVVPVRILDSRLPNVGFSGKVVEPTARSLQVTGLGGPSSVPATATAVVMNVTVAEATHQSFLTVFPSGTDKPNTSNLNFNKGEIIPNLVTVKLGAGGKVDMANAVGATHVVADVVGYYDDGTGPGDLFTGITPVRLLDSRTSNGGWAGKLPEGPGRDLVVRAPGNPNGVPATATAVIANVTVTSGDAQSFVSVWPSGLPRPNVSNLNLLPGQTIPNLVTVKIGANGAIRVANAVGNVHVIIDVVGYYDPTGGSRFHAMNPNRILDTRINQGLFGPQPQGATRLLAVAGASGTNVPSEATGLVANVTVADGTAESFVAIFPGDVARPNPFSNLNFAPHQVIPNLTAVRIAPNGTVAFYNHLGSTALVADAVGYFAPT